MSERIFVFKRSAKNEGDRPWLIAIPESKILTMETQLGSENCCLIVNGYSTTSSFNSLISAIGERVSIE